MSLSADLAYPKQMSNPLPSAFADAQALIDKMNAGEVQVLLVHGANPVYDLPKSAGFVEALAKVPLWSPLRPWWMRPPSRPI